MQYLNISWTGRVYQAAQAEVRLRHTGDISIVMQESFEDAIFCSGVVVLVCRRWIRCVLFRLVKGSYLHGQAGCHTEAGHGWYAIAVGQNWVWPPQHRS